ncbi:MAG: hypothetical protein LC800_05680, partial [Acidobacteria bacterium]|nr:hypothetical protein [Acidobacteriota bacterium]
NVTVTNSSNQVSNGIAFTALAAKLIPVTFTVYNASPTVTGDHIFLTGDTVELGNWATTWDGAVGPLLAPNYPNWFITASVPAGKTLQFKFIKIAANGAVTWEAGANHAYTVPAETEIETPESRPVRWSLYEPAGSDVLRPVTFCADAPLLMATRTTLPKNFRS